MVWRYTMYVHISHTYTDTHAIKTTYTLHVLNSPCIVVYIHCTFTHVQVSVQVHSLVWVIEARARNWVLVPSLSVFLHEDGISHWTESSLLNLGQLASELSGSSCLCPYYCSCSSWSHGWSLCGFWGFKLAYSHLQSNTLPNWAISPVPSLVHSYSNKMGSITNYHLAIV